MQELPLDALRAAGVLPDVPYRGAHKATLTRGALHFFGVQSPAEWHQAYDMPSVAYRRSQPERSDLHATSTWLRLGELEATQQPYLPFDREKFEAALYQIRPLTLEPLNVFAPQLKTLCTAAGVTLVFTRSIPRARVSGAARWLGDRAVIQLCSYGRKNDRFWFTFFHESCHLLKHSSTLVFLDDANDDDGGQEEAEANRFAEEWLIPPQRAHELRSLKSSAAVRSFAERIGIHPGIVVGRLQHDHVIDRSWMNDLRETFPTLEQW